MTTHTWINNKHYLNGVPKWDNVEIDEIEVVQIQQQLSSVSEQIANKRNGLLVLTNQRKQLVNIAYKKGISAINIGKLLSITRQSVYELIDNQEEE